MKESELQEWVAFYIRTEYPDAVFHSDFGSGVKMTLGQAMKQKRQNGGQRGWPDMFIAEPMGPYHGLFIELKKDGTRLRKKDGSFANNHIAEQQDMLERLNFRGYKATFAVGFDEAKEVIDNYMKGGR